VRSRGQGYAESCSCDGRRTAQGETVDGGRDEGRDGPRAAEAGAATEEPGEIVQPESPASGEGRSHRERLDGEGEERTQEKNDDTEQVGAYAQSRRQSRSPS